MADNHLNVTSRTQRAELHKALGLSVGNDELDDQLISLSYCIAEATAHLELINEADDGSPEWCAEIEQAEFELYALVQEEAFILKAIRDWQHGVSGTAH
ncbi:hypothetical protein [Dechloromonas sp.]|uniref:hypothetical protein n=1 Tax=Dechloromonas sp. TaxID=1917218 RepID=UPI00217109E3|nr:hypothetical protein [Dechloromonas sp.]MBU3696437.1 hypothetical protein [Dechloromonas sp.]